MNRFALAGRAMALAVLMMLPGTAAHAANQTPTTTPISRDDESLPYAVTLRRIATPSPLPTLQSFASAQYNGLWVLLGGRTNGLHDFTNDPLQNFPPSEQNRRVWVIDPATWRVWSRPLSDSRLSQDQVDELSATATEHLQIGNRLYVVGGYGFQRSIQDFRTFPTLTAFDLDELVAWVRRTSPRDLSTLIRQRRSEVLRVTGGELTNIGDRAILAFGQDFRGGYGSPNAVQTYTGQVRSFRIVDNGTTVQIADVRQDPATPNYRDFRRRDYNLVPVREAFFGGSRPLAVALAGVFTLTDGIFTVPVEIGADARPRMANPNAASTFKQGMNGYSSAHLGIFDSATGGSHTLLFGGISYITFNPATGTFVVDNNFPFTSQATALVRDWNGSWRQVLLERGFPPVIGPSGTQYLFGADAEVFLADATPTTDNEMVNLFALPRGSQRRVGWIFGGIAAEQPNFGRTVASNEVFEVLLTRR